MSRAEGEVNSSLSLLSYFFSLRSYVLSLMSKILSLISIKWHCLSIASCMLQAYERQQH